MPLVDHGCTCVHKSLSNQIASLLTRCGFTLTLAIKVLYYKYTTLALESVHLHFSSIVFMHFGKYSIGFEGIRGHFWGLNWT